MDFGQSFLNRFMLLAADLLESNCGEGVEGMGKNGKTITEKLLNPI